MSPFKFQENSALCHLYGPDLGLAHLQSAHGPCPLSLQANIAGKGSLQGASTSRPD